MRVVAKMVTCSLILILMLIPNIGYSKELKKGMRFLDARRLLIKSKWRPVVTHTAKSYTFIGVENELVKAHIEEVESCAVDKAICQFNYKKGNKCLRLFTQGEKIKDMRVYHWSDECPDY